MPKKMICMLVVLMLVFCGCYGKNDMSNYDIANISDISFLNVDNNGNITVLRTLPPEEISLFLDDFSQLKCYTYWNDPVEGIYGDTIRITLNDGSYYMIDNFCTAYCIGDNVDYDRKYYSAEEFNNLWSLYLRGHGDTKAQGTGGRFCVNPNEKLR